MKIALDQIKASPKPIRSSWDEQALNDLKWSLMEEGQVEPIGVHENGASLKASNWKLIGAAGGGDWSCKSRPRVNTAPQGQKMLWEAI